MRTRPLFFLLMLGFGGAQGGDGAGEGAFVGDAPVGTAGVAAHF